MKKQHVCADLDLDCQVQERYLFTSLLILNMNKTRGLELQYKQDSKRNKKWNKLGVSVV